jgi:hypothetical protein
VEYRSPQTLPITMPVHVAADQEPNIQRLFVTLWGVWDPFSGASLDATLDRIVAHGIVASERLLVVVSLMFTGCNICLGQVIRELKCRSHSP